MSLTEPTTSTAYESGVPLGEDVRRPAESPTTWNYLRSLSGAPAAGSADAPGWADDERLDELFSAWAKAALAADVVTDRRFVPADEPTFMPGPSPAGEAAPFDRSYEPPAFEGPAHEGAEIGPVRPEASQVWTPGDDDIIPRRRARGRWGFRRR